MSIVACDYYMFICEIIQKRYKIGNTYNNSNDDPTPPDNRYTHWYFMLKHRYIYGFVAEYCATRLLAIRTDLIIATIFGSFEVIPLLYGVHLFPLSPELQILNGSAPAAKSNFTILVLSLRMASLRNYLKTAYRCWRRYHNNPQAN